ncbi:acetate/propionate family kinase [Winogradskyella poriferorum]|uniref:acetate/propionate family kinase n=1 Tax=Winogradskyella poriferorum TaxID=307627 RepID=UPI003D6601EA
MKVLVLNSGSSSIKYQIFSMPEKLVICSGSVERIGLSDSILKHQSDKLVIKKSILATNHSTALTVIVDVILDKDHGVISDVNDIKAVGHRVVHGGSDFKDTVLINSAIKDRIKKLSVLAPLHNPANLEGIELAETIFVNAPQIAVFDTAFHQSIPEKAYKYAIPNTFLDKHKVRLYGFHGTSHKYVSEKAIDMLNKMDSKIITIHLGNGCSMTAVRDGKSIDHSLGFTPVNGLIMGTRSGDIDHSLIFYLVNTLGYDLSQVNTILQKESGMLGLTGYSDLREIESQANKGDVDCLLALEMNAYRIKKYIGSYIASMNGLDAIVFTAGIGENSQLIREMVCRNMGTFGIYLNPIKNKQKSNDPREINSEKSIIKILVIPTNEELEIANQVYALLNG